jgi:hypothetical protein
VIDVTEVEREVRLRLLLADSVRILFTDAQINPEMPRHHAVHIAHVVGFTGGLIACGVPEDVTARIAAAEIERYGE